MFLKYAIVMFLTLSVASWPSYAQDAELTTEELREVLSRLIELQAAREQIQAQNTHIERLEELQQREDELNARALELQQRLTSVAERERDTEQRRADQLQELLEAQNKRSGLGCVVKKIFTLGIARC